MQLFSSPVRPKDFTTNAPHLLAVWHEFERAPLPLSSIAQGLDCGQRVPVKVDIVSGGGDVWIKVNTYVRSFSFPSTEASRSDERTR